MTTTSPSPSFASILDESPTEVKTPAVLPEGTYLCRVTGPLIYDKSSKKGTDCVKYTLTPLDAYADVDADLLADADGLEGKSIPLTYWLTEKSVFMLDQFHEACGIDLADGESRRSRNDACINAEIVAYIKHRPSDDNKRIFMEVTSVATP